MTVLVRCRACQSVVYESEIPFTKLPKKCPVCGCIEFYVPSVDDLERERLRALEASGCLISSLLGD